jgi:1-acyl-sn-glycerol-3-phosphate acyltransferase
MNWSPKSDTPPPGYRYGGRYRASMASIARGIAYILRGTPRPLAHDALYAIADMPEPPLVRDAHLLPATGPFVIVANHYERPGLWMAWPALFLAHVVLERTGRDLHWVAIETWESFSLHGVDIPPDVIRLVFQRAFRTYGIIAMAPPAAPAAARAASMRSVTSALGAGEVVGIMPEGTVGATPELLPAMEGAGAFLFLLARRAPLIPVGFYEERSRLVAHVGPAVDLSQANSLPRQERDGWVRNTVMSAIRDLLPEPLHGTYPSGA